MPSTTQDGSQFAKVTFLPKAPCDVVVDDVMGEIARRLQITWPVPSLRGTLYVNPLPPEDKTLLWLAQDPISQNPVGAVKQYNIGTDTWETVAILTETQVVQVTPGLQTKEIEITGDGTFGTSWANSYDSTDYALSAYPTGSPAGAEWYVSSKSVGGASITVSGWTANFKVILTASGVLA